MKKKSNKKGFTIMEMLIVVAIIAVLAAIAIPVFNGALTKSKEAADVANIRAAYADMQISILTEDASPTKGTFTSKLNALGTLNYSDKLEYTPTGANDSTVLTKIKYNANKLDGTFEWSLKDPTVN